MNTASKEALLVETGSKERWKARKELIIKRRYFKISHKFSFNPVINTKNTVKPAR